MTRGPQLRVSWAILGALALAGTACVHHRPGTDTADQPALPVLVNVVNHYVMPVDVYAQGSGVSYRMGTVLPGLESRFVVRSALINTGGMVEVVGYPADRMRVVRSGSMLLVPGDIVDCEITTHLIISTCIVRP